MARKRYDPKKYDGLDSLKVFSRRLSTLIYDDRNMPPKGGIEKLREDIGLSCKRNKLQDIIRGKVPPTLDELYLIAKYYGKSVAYFAGEDVEDTPTEQRLFEEIGLHTHSLERLKSWKDDYHGRIILQALNILLSEGTEYERSSRVVFENLFRSSDDVDRTDKKELQALTLFSIADYITKATYSHSDKCLINLKTINDVLDILHQVHEYDEMDTFKAFMNEEYKILDNEAKESIPNITDFNDRTLNNLLRRLRAYDDNENRTRPIFGTSKFPSN